MRYEDADFKTISDRYTQSRMLPFLTYTCTDGVRANLFSINPWQNMTRTMVNQQLFFLIFFHRKIGSNKLFVLIQQRYDIFIWKWATSWEKSVFFLSYVNNKGADQPAHPRSLISAFIVRCLDTLRKRLSIRSVISVNYHYINVLCPFNLLIRFKCYSTV